MKLRYYFASIGRLLQRDPPRRTSARNLYEYVNSHPTFAVDPLGLYGVSGHFYTTFLTGRAVGLSADQAYELAYWSQYPDEDSPFSALGSLCPLSPSFLYSGDVYDFLHSMHGGDVELRRAQLACLLSMGEFSEPWERGFLIHAFADSFAHTYPRPAWAECLGIGASEWAYGYPLGHGLDGHAPDYITSNTGNYSLYMHSLVESLGGADQQNAVLRDVRNLTDQLVFDRAVRNISDPAAHEDQAFQRLAEQHGLDPQRHPIAPSASPLGTRSARELRDWLTKISNALERGCCSNADIVMRQFGPARNVRPEFSE